MTDRACRRRSRLENGYVVAAHVGSWQRDSRWARKMVKPAGPSRTGIHRRFLFCPIEIGAYDRMLLRLVVRTLRIMRLELQQLMAA